MWSTAIPTTTHPAAAPTPRDTGHAPNLPATCMANPDDRIKRPRTFTFDTYTNVTSTSAFRHGPRPTLPTTLVDNTALLGLRDTIAQSRSFYSTMPPFQPFAASWSRGARRDGIPRTPEPALDGDAQPPSPPRPQFRVKRRNAPNLNAPTQQFLASVVMADIPIPSIEEPRVLDEELADTMSPISQLSDMDDIPLTPDGGSDRMVSPPKTPAPGFLPSLSPKQYPNWSVDSTLSSLESSPDYESSRPPTAHSTHTSTSLLSYFSICSEELSQYVSPETEHADHFSELSSAEDNDKTINAATREAPREQLRRAPWTKPMIRHLWSTYMMYLQDPKVTPLRLGKSGIPPQGVCLRVAREAKRSWKGTKAQANADQNCGSIPPTARGPSGPYVQWPHTCAATRAQLRELCKMNVRTNARSNQCLAPSPTPCGKSAARF